MDPFAQFTKEIEESRKEIRNLEARLDHEADQKKAQKLQDRIAERKGIVDSLLKSRDYALEKAQGMQASAFYLS